MGRKRLGEDTAVAWKRRKPAPVAECPCGCGKRGLSQRQVQRHRRFQQLGGLGNVPDGGRDDVGPADADLDEAAAGLPPVDRGDDDVEPGARAGVGLPPEHSYLWEPLLQLVNILTVGALLTMMLALQMRFHMSGIATITVMECMVAVSLAAVPILKARGEFKRLYTPSVHSVHFCVHECVSFAGDLDALNECPCCNEPRYDAHNRPQLVALSHLTKMTYV